MKNKMVAVMRYPAGNIRSVLFALERLGVEAEWTADPQMLHAATHVIFPGMGWNTCAQTSGPLFEGLSEDNAVYFVHSYFAGIGPDTIATTHHGTPFSAALQRDNFFAVQFHPEKSGTVGQRILQNFLTL